MTRGSEKNAVDEWFAAWCLWYWHGRKWGRPQPVYVRETPKRSQETGQTQQSDGCRTCHRPWTECEC